MATYDTWGGSWGTSWALSWTRTVPSPPPTPDTVSGGGGLDPGEGLRRRDLPAKPLGLPPKRKAKIDERVETAREIQAEVAKEASERGEVSPASASGFAPIETMSMSQIHEEIGALLRQQQTKDDEDRLMLLLLAAGS